MTDQHNRMDPESGADATWHLPVMLEETVELWHAPQGVHFVDGTLGNGGHAAALLARAPKARLLGIDRDASALSRAATRLQAFADRVTLRQGSYAHLDAHLESAGFPPQVDGILLDLGLGSHQLDAPERGFSFRFDGPLDMRFDQEDESRPTAAMLLQQSSEEELARIFWQWGEEPQSRKIAKTIVRTREQQPIERTSQMLACLQKAVPAARGARHSDVAARCFQALRIAVNEELQQLDHFLSNAVQWLAFGGRLVVICFHSLEDRRVKQHLRALSQGCICPPDLPVCGCNQRPQMKLLTRRALQASDAENQLNSRARTARLRAAEKL